MNILQDPDEMKLNGTPFILEFHTNATMLYNLKDYIRDECNLSYTLVVRSKIYKYVRLKKFLKTYMTSVHDRYFPAKTRIELTFALNDDYINVRSYLTL